MESRYCSKTGCGREAAACCGFNYSQRLVWLAPLAIEPIPSTYDLCERHASELRVPNGWSLEDRRPVQVEASLLLP
ncbi:MAG TPA: DUF3499 family protein [Actinomycetota bacterium]|nr:DUF3499 family protein [Actinomycetota bacterium]